MNLFGDPKKEIINELEFDENGELVTRARMRLFITKGKIENYVVQLEHLMGNDWKQVVRFNYSHGFVHKDIFDIYGNQVNKIDLGSSTNLKHVVESAIKDIKENYKDYIDKFKKQRLRE